jgi:hypothetical protein
MSKEYTVDYPHLSYSKGIDLLSTIAWATFFSWHNKYITKLTLEWQSYLKNDDHPKDLDDGLREMEKVVSHTLALLTGPMTLTLQRDMDEEIGPLFQVLDQAVLLSEYLSQGLCPELDRRLAQKIYDIKDSIVLNDPVPYQRLIPINEWRQELRDELPDLVAPLLPWYEWFTDLDEMTLSDIVDNIKSLEKEDFTAFGNNAGIIENLFKAIKADKTFYNELKAQAWAQEKMALFLATSQKYALFYLMERTLDLAGEMNEKVMNIGFQAVAVQAISDKPMFKEYQRIELLFLAAFCGPDLNDKERLSLFGKIEKALPDLTGAPEETLAYALSQWHTGKLAGPALAKKTLQLWESDLLKAADQIRSPQPYEDGRFRNAVKYVQEMPLDTIPVHEKAPFNYKDIFDQIPEIGGWIHDRFSEVSMCIQTFCAIPALEYGDHEEESKKEIKFPTPNPMVLSPIPTDKLLGNETGELNELRSNYDLSFGAITINGSGEINITEPKFWTGPVKRKKIDMDKDAIVLIIAVSGDKEQLKAALEQFRNIDSKSDPLPVIENVFWIIYYDKKE